MTTPIAQEDLTTQLAQIEGNGAVNDTSEAPPEPVYPTLAAWMADWVGQVIERKVRDDRVSTKGTPARWCACWWDHPEAVSRLAALWRAWESLRLDPTVGMSTWWRDHWDSHWPDLTGEYGPFAACAEEGKHVGPSRPLSITDPPRDWNPPLD